MTKYIVKNDKGQYLERYIGYDKTYKYQWSNSISLFNSEQEIWYIMKYNSILAYTGSNYQVFPIEIP